MRLRARLGSILELGQASRLSEAKGKDKDWVQMDGWMNGWLDGWVGEWVDRWMDRWMNGCVGR